VKAASGVARWGAGRDSSETGSWVTLTEALLERAAGSYVAPPDPPMDRVSIRSSGAPCDIQPDG